MAKNHDHRIKAYSLSNGQTRYMFKIYAGIDQKTGRRKQTTRRGFKTIKEAELQIARLELELSQNKEIISKDSKKFREIYKLWFETYKTTVKESTWASTKILFNKHILPKFGDWNIDKITVRDCQQIINQWAKEQPKTMKKLKNYTSNVFHYAESIEIIESNPIPKLQIPKGQALKKEEKVIDFYNKHELLSFLNAIQNDNKKYYTFFYLLAFTGLRKGEALALTWGDINFFSKELSVTKTITRGDNSRIFINDTKTKAGTRTIILDESTIRILQEWKKFQSDFFKIQQIDESKQLIFSDDNNNLHQPTITSKWLQQLYRKHPEIKKKISAHGFRHTHASLLFEAGVSMKDVQEQLGHADIQTTMNIYTHVTEDKKKETSARLASFMGM